MAAGRKGEVTTVVATTEHSLSAGTVISASQALSQSILQQCFEAGIITHPFCR